MEVRMRNNHFTEGQYYKHNKGRDAVINVIEVSVYDSGYEMLITWHIVGIKGNVRSPVQMQQIFVSAEHATDWSLYEPTNEI